MSSSSALNAESYIAVDLMIELMHRSMFKHKLSVMRKTSAEKVMNFLISSGYFDIMSPYESTLLITSNENLRKSNFVSNGISSLL